MILKQYKKSFEQKPHAVGTPAIILFDILKQWSLIHNGVDDDDGVGVSRRSVGGGGDMGCSVWEGHVREEKRREIDGEVLY